MKNQETLQSPTDALINALDAASDAWIVVYGSVVGEDENRQRKELADCSKRINAIRSDAYEKMEQAVDAGNGKEAREWVDTLAIIEQIAHGVTLAKAVYVEAVVLMGSRPNRQEYT